MTDIDALHAYLDDHDDDRTVRMALADALEEDGNELCEGYKALAVLNRRPWSPKDRKGDPYNDSNDTGAWYWVWEDNVHAYAGSNWRDRAELRHFALPDAWIDTFATERRTNHPCGWRSFSSRRAAEDAAARGFLLLPEYEKRKLLSALYGSAVQTPQEGVRE